MYNNQNKDDKSNTVLYKSLVKSEVKEGSRYFENPPTNSMNNEIIDTSHASDGKIEYRVNESAPSNTMNDRMIELLVGQKQISK